MVTACTKFEVSPDTYPVVSRFRNEEETKAWGLEPYDTEVADNLCIKALYAWLISNFLFHTGQHFFCCKFL